MRLIASLRNPQSHLSIIEPRDIHRYVRRVNAGMIFPFLLPLEFSFLHALLSPGSSASTPSCAKTLIARPDRKSPLTGGSPFSLPTSLSLSPSGRRLLPSPLPGTSLIVASRGGASNDESDQKNCRLIVLRPTAEAIRARRGRTVTLEGSLVEPQGFR